MPDTALDYITVKGFKSIASIEKLPLRPINVIIGANGAGKSNFIRVFSFLNRIRDGRLQDCVRKAGGAEQLLHFGSRITSSIEVLLSFRGGTNWYALSLAPTDDDSLYPTREIAAFGGAQTSAAMPTTRRLIPLDNGREAGISDPDAQHRIDRSIARWVWRSLGAWRVYHAHDTSPDSLMRKTAKVNDNEFLRDDGSNLSAFLYRLRHKYPESYRLIRATVRQVAPFFDDFLLQPERLNEETIRLAWKHKTSDQYFGASTLSDGSLRFIALATLFLQPESLRPSVILVDEPELGLHPYAITLLASLIRQASVQTQVVVSTQSSLLLDHFEPEDVLVADRVNDGTQLTRLKSADLLEWLQDYSLGQLWEKNQFGGRPGSA